MCVNRRVVSIQFDEWRRDAEVSFDQLKRLLLTYIQFPKDITIIKLACQTSIEKFFIKSSYRVFHLRMCFLKVLKMSENQYVDKKIRQYHSGNYGLKSSINYFYGYIDSKCPLL